MLCLVAANLGDSGFLVIRKGKVLTKSRPLQHYFDCPLQFGAFPEYVEATDTADMADLYTVYLCPGDIIVAGEHHATFIVPRASLPTYTVTVPPKIPHFPFDDLRTLDSECFLRIAACLIII